MDTIGLVDGGEYGHASRHLSYPPILHACLTAGIKISAYGFALSEEPFDPDLDSEEHRRVVTERFSATADYLNLYGYNPWRMMLNRPPEPTTLIMASQDGEHQIRLELLKDLNLKKILLMPPIANTIETGAQIADNADNNTELSIWYPLRFSRGVQQARDILNNGEFGTVSYAMTFGTTSYPHYWSRALPQYLDIVRLLMGEIENFTLRASGTKTRPSIAITAEHSNEIIGTLCLESNRFLQRYPHARFEVTGRRRFLVIDDAGLKRCSYFSTRGDSKVPHFTHDTSNLQPSIELINNWVDSHENPVPITDALQTMFLVDAIETECDKLNGTPIKADFRRNADGTYKKLWARRPSTQT